MHKTIFSRSYKSKTTDAQQKTLSLSKNTLHEDGVLFSLTEQPDNDK